MQSGVAGETLLLFPERAALLAQTQTLLVADPHFGKAATFRSSGIPVPGGTTADALERLDALLRRTSTRRRSASRHSHDGCTRQPRPGGWGRS